MAENSIQGRQKRRFKATTDSKHKLRVAPNVLERNFVAHAPNEKWVGDITYIRTLDGWLHLAVLLDLFCTTSPRHPGSRLFIRGTMPDARIGLSRVHG
jgi:transposase InsO family protein